MTFSYELPFATDVHAVRFYLGDTDAATALFQDEELEALLTQDPDPLGAAALAAETAAARYRNLGSLSVGDVRIDGGEVASAYERLAADLRGRITSDTPVPHSGGIEAADGTIAAPRFTTCGSGVPAKAGWPC